MFDGRFRSGVDRAVRPVGAALVRTGLSPDHLTAVGLVLALPAGWAIGAGHLGLGLGLLIGSAVPDLLDGALAKASGRASVRGAFFDSVADRVSDAVVLGGVAWYLQSRYHGRAFALGLAVLGASLLISYERAKAESLGLDAKGGLMERAERVVVLCVGLAFSVLLVPLLWAMLALTAATAVQRFVKVWRQASRAGRGADGGEAAPTGPRVPAGRAHDPGAAADAAGAPGAPSAEAPAGDEPAGARPAAELPLGMPLVAARWRAWREANGWVPRSSRYARSSSRSSAAARWHERRQARRREGAAEDGRAPLRRRSGSRRP